MSASDLSYVQVLDTTMAYRETGAGDPIVFLHGNPTSSYLWRNILPRVGGYGRCLAPDLVGMGGSAKRPGYGDDRYRFREHRRYLDGLLEHLEVAERVILVGHDWGAVLAMDWARRHVDAVRGIAYLETLVGPVSWSGQNAPAPALFGALRQEAGEAMVLRDNDFVEKVLPAGTLRAFSEAELDAYRWPYLRAGEDRRPTLTWAREIPIDGKPADVHDIVVANAAFMSGTPIPKLFINGEPGALLTGPLRDSCRAWPNQQEVQVAGLHFLPEDSPERIGRALTDWISQLAAPAEP